MCPYDNTQPPAWLSRLTSIVGACCIALLGWWTFSAPPDTGFNPLAPRAMSPCVMDQDGYFSGQLYGALELKVDWRGAQMRCDGMRRPDGAGLRLVFDEHTDEDIPGLLVVIAVPSATPGAPVVEQPAGITLIDQTSGAFFTTSDEPGCWTSFTEQVELQGTVTETWRINGELFCLDPLTGVNNKGSIRLGDFRFSGLYIPVL